MTPRYVNRPCTVTTVTNGDRDDFGDYEPVETERDTVVYIDQRRASERTDGASIGDEVWFGMLPADDPITEADRITVDGETYEVDGPPWRVFNPRLRKVTQVEVRLRRTPA